LIRDELKLTFEELEEDEAELVAWAFFSDSRFFLNAEKSDSPSS
jgi:hypothetical protein